MPRIKWGYFNLSRCRDGEQGYWWLKEGVESARKIRDLQPGGICCARIWTEHEGREEKSREDQRWTSWWDMPCWTLVTT